MLPPAACAAVPVLVLVLVLVRVVPVPVVQVAHVVSRPVALAEARARRAGPVPASSQTPVPGRCRAGPGID
ncbi:hypothetical protein GCM10010335_27640 [Streptomyces galbus]|nr:hypothetical protein GCM10010335_27640 [Streptomyces galbus]